jgi:hypothetical protein
VRHPTRRSRHARRRRRPQGRDHSPAPVKQQVGPLKKTIPEDSFYEARGKKGRTADGTPLVFLGMVFALVAVAAAGRIQQIQS